MCPGPIQKSQSEPAPQERGATRNSLEQPMDKSALAPERPKLRSNSLPNIPTPDMRTAALEARLVKAGVPQHEDFINGLLGQLITAGDLGGRHDDLEVSFLLSVVEGIKPRDTVEAMIASQMKPRRDCRLRSTMRLTARSMIVAMKRSGGGTSGWIQSPRPAHCGSKRIRCR